MAIAFGVQRFLHDVRHHRERYRQFIGISFVILVSVVGEPKGLLFFSGVVLVFLGIAARLWASGHIKKNKALATDGPYAYVRHPLYVGNITLGFGFALASSLWWSLPLLILILLSIEKMKTFIICLKRIGSNGVKKHGRLFHALAIIGPHELEGGRFYKVCGKTESLLLPCFYYFGFSSFPLDCIKSSS
jgi:hypothetical protein